MIKEVSSIAQAAHLPISWLLMLTGAIIARETPLSYPVRKKKQGIAHQQSTTLLQRYAILALIGINMVKELQGRSATNLSRGV